MYALLLYQLMMGLVLRSGFAQRPTVLGSFVRRDPLKTYAAPGYRPYEDGHAHHRTSADLVAE